MNGYSSKMMHARQRPVVYWPSHRRFSVNRLSAEQITLASVDEAEETEFERARVKYCDDLFSSIKSVCDLKSNSNVLNTIDCDNFGHMKTSHAEYRVPVESSDNCEILFVSRKSFFSLSDSVAEERDAKQDKCETSTDNEEVASFCNNLSANNRLSVDKDITEMDQAAFNLSNLEDSLPRLVITAPERLHDEMTGAFTLYSDVDCAYASLWSARLNFASASLAGRRHSEEMAENLDASCCSIDSVVTASSIDSGPRTFYDPALHRPMHLTATVVTPICNGSEGTKKDSSHSPSNLECPNYKQNSQAELQMEFTHGQMSATSNRLSSNSSSSRKPMRVAGRAITKLTFSPHKPSPSIVEIDKSHESSTKRDWNSLCSVSPCAVKRTCQRSATPKFEACTSLAASSYKTSQRTASPLIRDHRLAVGTLQHTPMSERRAMPKCSTGVVRRVPPKYSACRELASDWALNGTPEKDYRAEAGQVQKKDVTTKSEISPLRKRNPLAVAYDNVPSQRHVDSATLLNCIGKRRRPITMVHASIDNSEHPGLARHPQPIIDSTTSAKRNGRLAWHSPRANDNLKLKQVALRQSTRSLFNTPPSRSTLVRPVQSAVPLFAKSQIERRNHLTPI